MRPANPVPLRKPLITDAVVPVVDWTNKPVGEITLKKEVFRVPVRLDILHAVVKWQLAKRRQGTHANKSRSEVSGGGKQIYSNI
jgi:large subunit ribosomal protein L4